MFRSRTLRHQELEQEHGLWQIEFTATNLPAEFTASASVSPLISEGSLQLELAGEQILLKGPTQAFEELNNVWVDVHMRNTVGSFGYRLAVRPERDGELLLAHWKDMRPEIPEVSVEYVSDWCVPVSTPCGLLRTSSLKAQSAGETVTVPFAGEAEVADFLVRNAWGAQLEDARGCEDYIGTLRQGEVQSPEP